MRDKSEVDGNKNFKRSFSLFPLPSSLWKFFSFELKRLKKKKKIKRNNGKRVENSIRRVPRRN